MDEGSGTTANDLSGTGNGGTVGCVGTGCAIPTRVVGKVGNGALYYNPANSSQRGYVSAPSISVPSVSGAMMSVALWINPNASQVDSGWFLRNGTGADENYGFSLGSPSGGSYKLTMEAYNGSGHSAATASYFIPSGTWNHLVIVFTQGQTFRVYLNGVFQESVTFPFVSSLSTSNLDIGGNEGANQDFNGYIDDVRIYNRALSAAEVQALFSAEK